MTPELNQDIEARLQRIVEQKYQELLQMKLVIATTSRYRQEVFGRLGFKSVDGVSTADVDEQSIKRDYEKVISPRANPEDRFRSKHAEEVAAGKVEKLMTKFPNWAEGTDRLLVGLDTLPMNFEVDNDRFRGNAVEKPTEAEARKVIEIELNYLIDSAIGPKKKILEGYQGSIGFREIGIQVSTGIALKFPDEEHVRHYSANSFLEFENVKELSRREQTGEITHGERLEAIKQIVDQILAVYEAKGINASSISGGINFADDEIKQILDAREYPLDEHGERTTIDEAKVEKGVYLGAPEHFMKKILIDVVRDRVLAGKY